MDWNGKYSKFIYIDMILYERFILFLSFFISLIYFKIVLGFYTFDLSPLLCWNALSSMAGRQNMDY